MIEIRQMSSRDLGQVNVVFEKAFSSARLEEGLKQYRVSPCRPEFLRMYLDRSREGAFVAVDRKRVAGFNFTHLYGSTGWMGPLAILPGYQGSGTGKAIVERGIDYLKDRGAGIIGLETMPRNFRNIGFYLRLGFEPGPLCIDMVSQAREPEGEGEGEYGPWKVVCFGETPESQRERILAGVLEVSETFSPGLDYRGEILLNAEHDFGDTVLLIDDGLVAGFAVCHVEPYGQFEDRRELKINVLAVRAGGPAAGPAEGSETPSEKSMAQLSALLAGVNALASRERLSAVRLHLRTDKWHALRKLLSLGYTVAYSDLRMWLSGFEEKEPPSYAHFCRWQ